MRLDSEEAGLIAKIEGEAADLGCAVRLLKGVAPAPAGEVSAVGNAWPVSCT